MRRSSFLLLLFCVLSEPALAQRTVVSGTVTDSSTLPYSGGSLTATLTTPVGTAGAYLNGAQISPNVGPVQLDSTGSFLLNLADNTLVQCANNVGQLVACVPQTKWSLAVTLSPGVPPPVGNGPQTCNSGPITISGASQTVTLNTCPKIVSTGVGGAPGGTNGQIQFNNSGAFGGTTATWNGTQFLAPNGSVGAPVYSFTSSTGSGVSFNPGTPEVDISVGGGRVFAFGSSFSASLPSNFTIGASVTSGFTAPASGALILNGANRFKLIDQGQCTMAAGTCAAQTFASTYAAAPVVFITWTGTGTCTGVLKAPSTTTTTTPASSVGTDTCQVNWIAFGN